MGYKNIFGPVEEKHPLAGEDTAGALKDSDAKCILKYRIVLANIVKYAIPEYGMYDLDTIPDMIPASNKTSDGFYVSEENTEDLEDRKHVYFDILFPVHKDAVDKVSIWCYIEPQRDYMLKPKARARMI